MFIQTEETPDHNTLRFLPGRKVSSDGAHEYTHPDDATESPLAEALLEIGGIRAVTLATDHVAVTRDEGIEWKVLKPAIFGAITDHFSPSPARESDGFRTEDDSDDVPGLVRDDEVSEQLLDLLETRIRPVAHDQGGDVRYVGFDAETGRVHLRLNGAAAGLLGGIQTMLRHYVPEVTEVVNHDRWVPRPGLDTDEGKAVQTILDNEINPAVASHGGAVRLIDVSDHTAYLEFGGGCHGCGMVDVTLKQGVETAILGGVPSITAVVDVTDHAEGANPYY